MKHTEETIINEEEEQDIRVQESTDTEDGFYPEPEKDIKEDEADLEEYDRGREKINVDDILETMQMIENPTSKKKDDFLF